MTSHQTHIRFARDATGWLLAEFAERFRTSPDAPTSELLAPLVKVRLGSRSRRIEPSPPAQQIETNPYLLETAVYLLKQQGLWPSDPKSALLCYREMLSVILDTAPGHGLPWEVTADVAAGG